MFNPKLRPIPDEKWKAEYDELRKDKYVKHKCHRPRRMKEHNKYLRRYIPEIFEKRHTDKYFLDLGPGCGETLEIARHMGYKTKGYDAKIENDQMGTPYVRMSKLMVERQQLDVNYNGFDNLDNFDLPSNSTYVINARGSLEMIYHKCLEGELSDGLHDSTKFRWREDYKTYTTIKKFFEMCNKVLCKDGIIMLCCNPVEESSNTYFEQLLEDINKELKLFELIEHNIKTQFKYKKL